MGKNNRKMMVVVVMMLMKMVTMDHTDDSSNTDGRGYSMARDFLGVVSEHREATAPNLNAVHFAEIQNWDRC